VSTFVSGTAGRVYITGSGNFAGIKSWRLDQTAAEIGIPNFESYVDSSLRVWPDYLVGLSGATGTLEGQFAIGAGAPTDGVITVGLYYTAKLQFNKTTTWGYTVSMLVTALGAGTNVENQPATFTASFRITAAPSLPGTSGSAVPLSAAT
jgi:hypothetical protein